MANIGAGFLTGFPAALSASRTAVNDQMGGKSQWVGLFAAALTIIFLLFLTPLLAPLPTVALGAIIIVASLGLIDLAAFRFLRQVRPGEFWLAVVTTLGVLTVGVLQGILVVVRRWSMIHISPARCAVRRAGCQRRHGVSRRRRQRDRADRAGTDRLSV
jgi:SulP family sulfate permease